MTKNQTIPVEIKNWDQVIVKKGYGKDSNWKNVNADVPQDAKHVIIAGPSGVGKTNIVLTLILDGHILVEQMLCFVKNMHEAKYRYLRDRFKKWDESDISEEELPVSKRRFYMGNDLTKLPNVEDLDNGLQKVVLFDDVINEKNQQGLKVFFERGRKVNCSTYYLGQDFFKIPSMVRDNCSYIMLFKPRSVNKRRELAKTLCFEIPSDVFDKKVLTTAFTPDQKLKNPFLFIDLDNSSPYKRFRRGFHDYINKDVMDKYMNQE
jgi:hypothetical protein